MRLDDYTRQTFSHGTPTARIVEFEMVKNDNGALSPQNWIVFG
jgi:arginase family enzyme